MITESELYWITRLDNFSTAACICIVISAILLVMSIIGVLMSLSDNDQECRSFFRRFLVASLICFIFIGIGAIFIPTTKEMAAIKGIPAIANSKFVSQDAEAYIRRLCEAVIGKIEQNGESKKKEK